MARATSESDKEQLRIIIGAALSMSPRKVRKDFAERGTWLNEPAKTALSDAIAGAVLDHYDLVGKPNVTVAASAHRHYLGKAEPEQT